MKISLCLILALVCVACDLQQDITFDDPETTAPEGPSVRVFWDGNEVEVFLDLLDKVLIEERLVCLLWDVLLEAGLEEEEIFSMRFDFESVDGFRPSSVGCDPLEGEILELGYLDPDGLALVWDATLGLRGCYWVTQTARILGEAVEKRPSAALHSSFVTAADYSPASFLRISCALHLTISRQPLRGGVFRHAPLGRRSG